MPPPRIRLTASEVSQANLDVPGMTWGLLRKLKIQREQISRGKACGRCRRKKLKCDGSAPCKNCLKAKEACDAEGCKNSGSKEDVPASSFPMDLTLAVDRPITKPYWGPAFSPLQSHDLGEMYAPARNPFASSFALYGVRKQQVSQMIAHLPSRLHNVLSQIGIMLSNAPPDAGAQFGRMPDNVDLWEGSTLGRQIIRIKDGCRMCGHNEALSQLSGAHPEEIATRINSGEINLFTSEYRLLCLHLFLILAQMQGVKQLVHLIPMISSFCRSSNTHGVSLHRVTRTFFQDGVINSGVPISADQWDAAVNQHPHARMEFVEDDLAGSEITGEVLAHRETIRYMASTVDGRAKLDRLADRVAAKFGLQTPAPSPLAAISSTPSPLAAIPSRSHSSLSPLSSSPSTPSVSSGSPLPAPTR